MFNRRRLENNLEDRVLNMQYRNRQAVRRAEQKVSQFVGVIFIIMVAVGYIGTWASSFSAIEPAQAKELEIIQTEDVPEIVKATEDGLLIQSVKEDLTLVDTPWRTVPKLENGSKEQNEKIAYAWKISGHKIDFIYMLRGENGLFTHDRVHNSSNNTVGVDMGLCGINSYFHPQIVNDPKFNDWKWQMDTCYQLWDGGVKFYGYNKDGIYF